MSEVRLGFPGNEKTVEAKLPDGSPVPWDLSTKFAVVGKDHPRVDAVAKVTGRAKYSYDIRFKDLIYAKLLRSPHAKARVKRVDLSKAKAMQGVLYTEVFGEGRTVVFAGQEVAGVAAESEGILADALAAIVVEYEILPCVTTVEDALKEGAPGAVQDGSNLREGGAQGDLAKVEQAHAQADVVVEAEYRTQVQTHSCLETHGSVCRWENGKLTVWASTQATFGFRDQLARAFSLKQSDVTVITEHMGGGFGSKFGPDVWDMFSVRAARETNRPCRSMLDRREEHLAGNRPDSIQKCKFSAKKDGTLMGAQVHSVGTGGVAGAGGLANPAIYRFSAQYKKVDSAITNASGQRAFRAPGHPQGVFALEGMMDELAEKIGMDPLEFRRKNDGNVVRLAEYDIGAKEIGWNRRRKSGSDKGPLKRGLGMASALWGHTGGPGSEVRCTIGRDGSVVLANGAQDLGTGLRTVIAVIGAEELGLEPGDVEVRLGNTNDPLGPGSGGSVTTPSMAPAIRAAAFEAKRELLRHVAAAVGGDAGAMDLKAGKVTGAWRELTFKQACGTMPVDQVTALGKHQGGVPTFNGNVAGVQFAEVEVDTETGLVRVVKVVAVQDCGIVVDALTARSQINGGVIQGISYALFEERLLDRRTGDQVNADFLNYKIAGSLDMPEIVSIPFSVSQGGTTTGVSSLGEPPTVPTAGAIGNAVANALGVRVRSLPITPAKVLAALGGAR